MRGETLRTWATSLTVSKSGRSSNVIFVSLILVLIVLNPGVEDQRYIHIYHRDSESVNRSDDYRTIMV